jgi:hypothetical protein
VGEIVTDDEVGRIGAVGVELNLVDRGLHDIGHRTALDAGEIEVGLVVDAPEFLGDQRAVDVAVERGVGVDVDDRRHLAVVGALHFGIDAQRPAWAVPACSRSG